MVGIVEGLPRRSAAQIRRSLLGVCSPRRVAGKWTAVFHRLEPLQTGLRRA
jgi:hypothetical protein